MYIVCKIELEFKRAYFESERHSYFALILSINVSEIFSKTFGIRHIRFLLQYFMVVIFLKTKIKITFEKNTITGSEVYEFKFFIEFNVFLFFQTTCLINTSTCFWFLNSTNDPCLWHICLYFVFVLFYVIPHIKEHVYIFLKMIMKCLICYIVYILCYII